MRDPVASVSRPIMQLRGFRRVALQPGETRLVRFTLTAAHFALWSGQGGWIIEPGRIELMAGSASDAIHARGELTIEGSAAGSQSPASIPVASTDVPGV
jgi:beta-glucosidase